MKPLRLDILPEREQAILIAQFGLDGAPPREHLAIAEALYERYMMTRERVRVQARWALGQLAAEGVTEAALARAGLVAQANGRWTAAPSARGSLAEQLVRSRR